MCYNCKNQMHRQNNKTGINVHKWTLISFFNYYDHILLTESSNRTDKKYSINFNERQQ